MNQMIIELFRRAIPYVIAACVGFAVAFWVQEFRVTAAKQETKDAKQALADYKLLAREALQDEKDRQEAIAEKTNEDWHKNLDALHEYYRKRMLPQTLGGGVTLPASAGGAASNGQDAVPSPARVAEECAETTLQLNMLQDWTERVRKEK